MVAIPGVPRPTGGCRLHANDVPGAELYVRHDTFEGRFARSSRVEHDPAGATTAAAFHAMRWHLYPWSPTGVLGIALDAIFAPQPEAATELSGAAGVRYKVELQHLNREFGLDDLDAGVLRSAGPRVAGSGVAIASVVRAVP